MAVVSSQAHAPADALRALLLARDVPPARIALAERAVRSLDRALTRREDGGVFVITGDIPAMWLRDSTGQVAPLLALEAPELAAGVLRVQIEQVLLDPRANAFNLGPTGARVRRDFRDQSPWVFERKYAVDSLCAPITLAWRLRAATGSTAHVDDRFREAARRIVAIWREGQDHERGSYVLRRRLARRADSLSHGGRGAPVAPTGMTWSAFRPSDDACTYGYHVPANAYAAVSLERLADLVGDPSLRVFAAEIRAGIERFAVLADGRYAYEVDGLGNAAQLDDANVPSLLSLPYLGFCAPDDPRYLATRDWVLSPRNPYWSTGRVVHGVGSSHTRRGWVWPLAIAVEGLTAIEAGGREDALARLERTVTGDLLFHESIDPNAPRRFTRRWFSWADMLYVELVLASRSTSPSNCQSGFGTSPVEV
jgi:meiotically up-regulated gene 157 (Mug157) protein